MTESDDKSTCKYIKFRPISDIKPESKVPIFGHLLFEDECPVESHTFPLHCKDFIIGREKLSHLRVMTPIASRVHCVISYGEDDAPTLINKSSINKTCVNDVVVDSSIRLIDGASIKVGQHVFKYKAIDTNSGQEDTVACDSTLEEMNIENELEKMGNGNESNHENQEVDEPKHEEKAKIQTGKKNGRKVNAKTRKKREKPIEDSIDGHSEEHSEHESGQEDKHEIVNESSGESDAAAAPLAVSAERSENEDAPIAEEKDNDDDVSASADEKMNDEASPLKLRGKNNLKVTFKPGKEPKKTQKSPQNASDAVRRSNRRRPNASEPISVEDESEEPKESKKAKTTRNVTGNRRKKTVNEAEEPPAELEEKVQEEGKKSRRGRKAKVEVVSDESAANKPTTTRITRSRK